ncbi:hypothetical protein [Candidatus Mycobacterium methanotrophicum]|uniref:DUF3800 domain-containing protein n=1 Tax=Candidatus Mycobacterium methanotrophicum TaxID=2943498 RepID=A0ABY4QMP8_9MYCO|nr:hypothetical protein [Candidatus Mycobacterium methanotrophicum]UQX11058.1 hypothetical protein M5I08_00175 [Candidatus Mycobacterium methanotrophicum]
MSIYAAWLDESGSNPAIDPNTYILSAVIGEAEHAPGIRESMRGLLVGKGHKKLHWRTEAARRQELIVKTIAALEVEYLVVVRAGGPAAEKPERRRRLCMERMLPELVKMGVDEVVIESRGSKDDRRDVQRALLRLHRIAGDPDRPLSPRNAKPQA